MKKRNIFIVLLLGFTALAFTSGLLSLSSDDPVTTETTEETTTATTTTTAISTTI